MTDDQIVVLGATGTVGKRLTRLLSDAGHRVRGVCRSCDPRFDWADRSTWAGAIAGATSLYLLAPDGVPVDEEFVAAAVDGGVRRIVLQSSGGIEVMGDERLLGAERLVRACGVDWTILRPSWFAQNFDEGFFTEAVLAGQVSVPVGDARQAFVDAGDIAAVAAVALTRDGHAGAGYEVTGPRSLTFGEAVQIIAEAAGRPVSFDGTAETYRAVHESLGRPRDEIEAEVAAFGALAAAGDARPGDCVIRLTGRAPKTFERYAADAAATGAWRG